MCQSCDENGCHCREGFYRGAHFKCGSLQFPCGQCKEGCRPGGRLKPTQSMMRPRSLARPPAASSSAVAAVPPPAMAAVPPPAMAAVPPPAMAPNFQRASAAFGQSQPVASTAIGKCNFCHHVGPLNRECLYCPGIIQPGHSSSSSLVEGPPPVSLPRFSEEIPMPMPTEQHDFSRCGIGICTECRKSCNENPGFRISIVAAAPHTCMCDNCKNLIP